ncbi:MAG: glycine cleavage system protein GcvH [Candidatus Eisenbacteria bacterium]|nr:glycine cleavage system protein GcvH [Candidatus Eisenbacteria bacterium]
MSAKDLKFTDTHEWIRVDGDVATLGLTDYAQGELGDIVFVELPEAGRSVSAGDVLTTVESVKSVSEIYVPVDGEIVESNQLLEDDPAVINSDPYGDGWIVKMKVAAGADLSRFMSDKQYQEHIKG